VSVASQTQAPSYVLVTFIVSEDGEPLKPMTEEIARIDLDPDGTPVSPDGLTSRVAREIRRRWGQPAPVATEV
jgi:hypothetical protein